MITIEYAPADFIKVEFSDATLRILAWSWMERLARQHDYLTCSAVVARQIGRDLARFDRVAVGEALEGKHGDGRYADRIEQLQAQFGDAGPARERVPAEKRLRVLAVLVAADAVQT
jgi:hypothetical protein